MLEVCLMGTGGMMPLPRRWLTSLMTKLNGSSLIVDCGEGTQIAIKEKGWTFKQIDIICITHFHGDHISGLPGLLLTIGNADRTEPITIIGPKGLEEVVTALRIIAPELPFELEFIEFSEPVHEIQVKDYCIRAFKVQHNVMCYGYNILVKRAGKFEPEKAKMNLVPMKCWSRLQKGETVEEDGTVYTQDMILGPERKGIKVTYCTDTRPIGRIAQMAQASDLFICEGMYGDQEDIPKALKHKHMTFYEAAELAKQAEVDKLWLTHYSPALVRPQDYLEQVRTIFNNTMTAKDGMSVLLEFQKE